MREVRYLHFPRLSEVGISYSIPLGALTALGLNQVPTRYIDRCNICCHRRLRDWNQFSASLIRVSDLQSAILGLAKPKTLPAKPMGFSSDLENKWHPCISFEKRM